MCLIHLLLALQQMLSLTTQLHVRVTTTAQSAQYPDKSFSSITHVEITMLSKTWKAWLYYNWQMTCISPPNSHVVNFRQNLSNTLRVYKLYH